MAYKIVRTFSAGVFFGDLDPESRSKNGKRGVMRDARRLWYWAGAASLSQLAMEGTKKPRECKFPIPVSYIELTEIIEVLDVTCEAIVSIKAVPEWKE